jgi:hypothetical protein
MLMQSESARHRPMIRCIGLSDAGLQRHEVLRKYEVKGGIGKALTARGKEKGKEVRAKY